MARSQLSVGGQIYLYDNPLLREPLKPEHVKPRLLGHWGTTPGLNFIYVHLNRLIKQYDLNAIYITGPGHGGPGLITNTYLEGTYSEFYPRIPQNAEGMKRLFKQFSFPGGVPSHVAPETPGSIHEFAPTGDRRMGANPHANGGLLLKDLAMAEFLSYAVDVPEPGRVTAEATRVLGQFLRDVVKLNPKNFRVMGPDETASNRLCERHCGWQAASPSMVRYPRPPSLTRRFTRHCRPRL